MVHVLLASESVVPAWCFEPGVLPAVAFRAFRSSATVTVGHPNDEQPLAKMRRANFRRAEQSRRNAETQSFEVGGHSVESVNKVPVDILEEHEPRLRFLNNSAHIGP